MSVYRKGRLWHYDFVYQGRRFYGSTGQDARRNAEAVERVKRLEAASGAYADASKMTVQAAADRYWREVGQDKRSAGHVKRRLQVMMDCVGPARLLMEIDSSAVMEAVSRRRGMDLGRGLPSRTTVNRDIIDTTLRPLLNRAKRVWGAKGLNEIDWRSIRLTEPKPEHREYSDKQIEAWLDELEPVPRFALHLLLRYGLRLGELRFGPDDVDGVAMRLTIRGKSRKTAESHTIPLIEEDARILAGMATRARLLGLSEVLFHGDPPEIFPADGIGRRIRSAAKRAGINMGRVVHGARHHAGTQILRKTGNLKLAQRLLGHASIQSTVRYAHASEDDLRDALNSMSPNSPEVENGTSGKLRKTKGKSDV